MKKKYHSIEEAVAKNDQQTSLKKIDIVELETMKHLEPPFSIENKSSLARYNNRDRQHFNILSLDSARYTNHIVNTIFVAEI